MAQVLEARRSLTALPGAHFLLRRGTRRLHARIDRTSVLSSLTGSGVSLAAYQAAMQGLQRAYEEVDLALLRGDALRPEGLVPYTPRVPRIERDLKALRAPVDPLRGPRPGVGLKVPDTEAAYLGVRYVVEGAQFGRRFVYGQLCCRFGAGIHEFGTFWIPEMYPEGSWPSLLKSLARVESREGLATCVRTARLTFQHMEVCLRAGECEVAGRPGWAGGEAERRRGGFEGRLTRTFAED